MMGAIGVTVGLIGYLLFLAIGFLEVLYFLPTKAVHTRNPRIPGLISSSLTFRSHLDRHDSLAGRQIQRHGLAAAPRRRLRGLGLQHGRQLRPGRRRGLARRQHRPCGGWRRRRRSHGLLERLQHAEGRFAISKCFCLLRQSEMSSSIGADKDLPLADLQCSDAGREVCVLRLRGRLRAACGP